ncbi:MAG TPA: 2-C-methyl-D-erythritol 2,4-cyclodiphosphate synthase [Acidimicrobiia bacterium]|nr:2-C-methyl-D-erythritol 2,4-cyclodiphosphate synthase [Acidimicrobiia bacterium]
MSETRVGFGFDAHRFSETPPVLLGGVVVDDARGVEATSDGDVAAHAVSDAILGAAALGDMGVHFPSTESRWEGADSMGMLRECVRLAAAAGVIVESVDVTVISQSVRVAPFRDRVREGLAAALGIDVDRVSVKATTTDHMGAIGRDEGLAAQAVATCRAGIGVPGSTS